MKRILSTVANGIRCQSPVLADTMCGLTLSARNAVSRTAARSDVVCAV